MKFGRQSKQPGVEYTCVPSGDMPPRLYLPSMYPDSVETKMKVGRRSKQLEVEDTCVPSGDVPPCLYLPLLTVIVRQITMLGVAAGTSTNKILTMWPSMMEMKNKTFSGLAPLRNLEQRSTRRWLVAVVTITKGKWELKQ